MKKYYLVEVWVQSPCEGEGFYKLALCAVRPHRLVNFLNRRPIGIFQCRIVGVEYYNSEFEFDEE